MLATFFALALAAADAPAPNPSPFVTQPVWLKHPNGDDLARYRPEDAQVSGLAVIECRVSKRGLLEYCRVLEESPGEQYGKAALAIAAKFRMGPADRAGVPTAGRSVRLPIAWTLPEPLNASVPVTPQWVHAPSGDEMAAVYPAQARWKSGRAVLACRLSQIGRPTDCTVAEETPAGLGFGEAALKLAPLLRFTTRDASGKSLVGGTFRIPLSWSAPMD